MTDESGKEGLIDLDDPSLKEAQTYDPEADADAFIPPPELDDQGNAITYTVKLRLGKNKFEKHEAYYKRDKKDRPMAILMVDVEISDPSSVFDKARLGAEYLNTFVNPRTSASSYTNMARLLGSPFPKGLGVQEQSSILEGLIASEPLLGARISWGAYCKNCEEEKPYLEGERKWPEKQDEQGNVVGHLALAQCKDCNSDITPKVSVRSFRVLGS